MTDVERLALASKLDKELDEFINGLEKRQYTEGWPEDRWEAEMEKHPFFMKKTPEPGDELHPLLEGIQQLKYDPAENTAEELATSYKEDGNFNFKHKKYRLAILSYTEGIKQKHDNTELKATLHNNRAAAHYFIKNYRSCLRDCERAMQYKPDYDKAITRAAHCCYEIAQYERCMELCDMLLHRCSERQDMLALRQQANNAQKARARDARKRNRDAVMRARDEMTLVSVMKERGIQLETDELKHLEPHFPELAGSQVHLDNGQLVWPVVMLYPEYKTMDFVQQFHESMTVREQLMEIFAERPSWDTENKYHSDTVHVYYEHGDKCRVQRVDVNSTLAEILVQPGCVVRAGTPSLLVFAPHSTAEQHFLSQYKR